MNNKKGQVTIFVIVAIVIVAGIVLFFTMTDTGKRTLNSITGGGDFEPISYLENCVQAKDFSDDIDLMLSQGGYLEPEFYYDYGEEKITYLCYTTEYFKTCTMQKPMLLKDIENQIAEIAKPEVEECVNNLKEELRNRGYEVNSGDMEIEIDITPEDTTAKINMPLTIKKDTTKTYQGFEVGFDKKIYEIIMIATSILNYEARFGDSDPVAYMTLYPNVRIEVLTQTTDGTKIYSIKDRNYDTEIKFAVRSLVMQPGYYG